MCVEDVRYGIRVHVEGICSLSAETCNMSCKLQTGKNFEGSCVRIFRVKFCVFWMKSWKMQPRTCTILLKHGRL